MFSNTLNNYPTSGSPLQDPKNGAGNAADWATSDSHVYQITVSLANNNTAQGKNASANFTWEAGNK